MVLIDLTQRNQKDLFYEFRCVDAAYGNDDGLIHMTISFRK